MRKFIIAFAIILTASFSLGQSVNATELDESGQQTSETESVESQDVVNGDTTNYYDEDIQVQGDDEEVVANPTPALKDSDYMDYSGPVDMFTGLPEGVEEVKTTGIVTISEDVSYDRSTGMFRYEIDHETHFYCSVADGMVTTDEVRFSMDGDGNVIVYKDGYSYSGIPDSVSDPGSYVVQKKTDGNSFQMISFRIVNSVTGVINQYVMPDGFRLSSVYLNGVEVNKGYSSVDLTEEGSYEILYHCSGNGLDYELDVDIDHTPPQIKFKGLDKDNRARGPVKVKGLQDGDTVYVTLNKKETHLNLDNELTESGLYYIAISDEAGNTVEKTFRILIYLNVKAIVFISIILAIIVGVIVALYITRKRLRVR